MNLSPRGKSGQSSPDNGLLPFSTAHCGIVLDVFRKIQPLFYKMKYFKKYNIPLVGIVFLTVCCFSFGDEYVQQVEEMQKNWKAYLHKVGHFACTVVTTESEGKKQVHQNEILIDCDYPFFITRSRNKKSVTGYNDKYYFSVEENESGSWFIRDALPIPPPPSINDWDFLPASTNLSATARMGYVQIAHILTNGLRLFPVWLPSLCKEPDFHINSLETGFEDGCSTIALKFSFHTNSSLKSFCPVEGEVVLFKDNYYLIKRGKYSYYYDNRSGKLGTVILANEYDFSTFDIPVLIRQTMDFQEGEDLFNKTHLFSDYEQTQGKDVKRFTLSAYGIPEPDFDGSQRIRPIRYILIGSGFLLIALALWLMYRKHQEKKNERKKEDEEK
ncbi:hypothetical protein FACS189419_03580 [Planctomycetales bacterium]|nr:hypothetical protein FACS189419_03580 [Planctomycetales bacterium]